MSVTQADSTLVAIRKKVRRLTSSSSESALPTSAIDEYINTFYTQDFAYAIHIDQQRTVYEFFTSPNVDKYPLNINKYQSIRDPVYFEGVQGQFYKDRNSFYNVWPRAPYQETIGTGDGSTQSFTYTASGLPILANSVVIGGTTTGGVTIRVSDDGNGILNYQAPDSLGDYTQTAVGTVNYVTGAILVDFSLVSGSIIPADGVDLNLWAHQYQAGRPYCLLYWNNEFTVRPVPDNVYKVTVEAYQTPTEFMSVSQSPTLNQWWQYIALGSSIKVLEDRQDMEGVQNLVPLFDRQESLILERQANEEIGQANGTIYSSQAQSQNYGSLGGWY